MRNKFFLTLVLLMFLITGCTTAEKKNTLEEMMQNVVSYEINEIATEHSDKIYSWLNEVQQSGKDGEFFTHHISDNRSDYMYTYVYGKGFTDYEVSFVYNLSDMRQKNKMHITGIKGDTEDAFVKIKTINDMAASFILSLDTIDEKLNN